MVGSPEVLFIPHSWLEVGNGGVFIQKTSLRLLSQNSKLRNLSTMVRFSLWKDKPGDLPGTVPGLHLFPKAFLPKMKETSIKPQGESDLLIH